MPSDFEKARDQWARYVHLRDDGHRAFVEKATLCDNFFAGFQWDETVVKELAAQKRPALTVNKILITLSSIFGEQIDLRSETVFKPRFGAPANNAETLTKLFRYISEEEQLNWKRSEVFANGCVTSRGFYDVRLKFRDNIAGECAVESLNPKSVLLDSQAYDYDPDTWNDVMVTSWATVDDLTAMFPRKKAMIERLSGRGASVWDFGQDSLDISVDTFGGLTALNFPNDGTDNLLSATDRSIRVLERQHKVLVQMKYMVDPKTGDKMRVPAQWDREQVDLAVNAAGLVVVTDVGRRVRWTVTAEEVVLHDDWSPFERFTIIPYFPSLRNGRTTGLVESLIDPQNLLNKTLSQELHIVNTMANSGWKVRSGVLTNMTVDELEQEGAKTGLVVEVDGDPDKDLVKITPNQIPQGLDRLSFKAENFIKSVSGRGDSQLGLDRADVSGRAINEKKDSSQLNLRVALDNLERTDWLMARHILDIIQQYYTDHRIMNVTRMDGQEGQEQIDINLPDPATGEILNDLTLGTYNITISSQNARRTLEETEFAQAQGLRELGLAIPDRYMLKNSNLRGKEEIIKAMDAAENSPEGQIMKESKLLMAQLQVAELRAKVSKMEAEAVKARAKATTDLAGAEQDAAGDPAELERLAAERAASDQKLRLAEEAHQQKLRQERELFEQDKRLREQEAADKRRFERLKAATAAAATIHKAKASAAAKPKQGARA